MCERYEEIAKNIDPEFLKLMMELEPEYRALEAKVSHQIKDILELHPTQVTGEEITDLPQEDQDEVNAAVRQIANVMGMAALLGWHSVSNLNDKEKIHYQIGPMMEALQSAMSESVAFLQTKPKLMN